MREFIPLVNTENIKVVFDFNIPIQWSVFMLNNIEFSGSSRRNKPGGSRHRLTTQMKHELREAFDLFDADGNGILVYSVEVFTVLFETVIDFVLLLGFPKLRYVGYVGLFYGLL
ncbi:putative EF-hand domain-containing protein [Helianthus annuus]|nr:putative EF-hand domain-containing protein [Helianthus annuus]